MMKDSDVNGAIAVSHNGVTIRYAISIGLVAILVVAVTLTHYTLIDKQKTSATVINLSGRQRMLSQRAAFFSLQLIHSHSFQKEDDIRGELLAIADRMEKSHNGLLRGDRKLGLPGDISAESRAIFLESPVNLNARVKSYVQMIRKLATSPESHLDASIPALKDIHLAAQDELINSLDLLVHQFENEGKLAVINLQTMELAAEIIKIRPGTPVALCTGFSDSVTTDKAREMGIREFVMKPFGTREFAETMSRLTAPRNVECG